MLGARGVEALGHGTGTRVASMMRRLGLALSVVLVLLLVAPTSAGAAPSGGRWVGVLDGTEPTYDPNICGTLANYDVVGPVTPTVSGDYHYGDLSISYDVDVQIEVYMNSFDSSNPLTNLIGSADDWGTFPLLAGTPYYFVVSALCDGSGTSAGTWDFVMIGPGPLGGTDLADRYAGVFTGTEPIFNSPYCGPGNGYQVVGPLTPTVSGDYHYGDLSIGYAVDMQIDGYANRFDPLNPFANHIGSADDNGTFALSSGTPYYFVVSPLCGGLAAGVWEFVLAGPGRLTAIAPVPALSPLAIAALLAGVLGIGAYGLRRGREP